MRMARSMFSSCVRASTWGNGLTPNSARHSDRLAAAIADLRLTKIANRVCQLVCHTDNRLVHKIGVTAVRGEELST